MFFVIIVKENIIENEQVLQKNVALLDKDGVSFESIIEARAAADSWRTN